MKIDIAIVGAGPAGSWAAYNLARHGARVTIFDPSHPREKPCGGGVTGRALALVADQIDEAAFPRTAIRSARFTRGHADMPAGAGSSVVALDTRRPGDLGKVALVLVALLTAMVGAEHVATPAPLRR